MNFKKTLIAVALILSTGVSYAGGRQANLSGFDFNYSVDLNKSIGLTQVFDDGDRTYFQFTQADSFPTLYVVKDGKKQQVSIEVRPPYLIVAGVASKYVLSANNGKNSIYVSYNGTRVEEAPAAKSAEVTLPSNQKAATSDKESEMPAEVKSKKPVKKVVAAKPKEAEEGSENNDEHKSQELVTGVLLNIPFFENSISLSKKAKADLSQRSAEITQANKVVVRGRPSVKGDSSLANTRALVIKNYLVEIGIDESLIELKPESTVKSGKNQGFYVSELILISSDAKSQSQASHKKQALVPKVDTTLTFKNGDLLSERLTEWAKRAYNYDVVWEADQYRSTAPMSLDKGFNETIDAVIGAMKINNIYLDVTTYENHVIRVVEAK